MIYKFFRFILALILLALISIVIIGSLHADLRKLPPLESGDLIFQSFINSQSLPIIVATGSVFTHVGIIHKQQDGVYTVIHAARQVVETPLNEFIHYGWGERFIVLRYPGLSDAQRDAIISSAQSYLGRNYNYVFYMKAKELYCSELPLLAYGALHLTVGTVQKIGDLHMNNPVVEDLFSQRWKMHPACTEPGMDYKACWKEVLSEPIITPVSIKEDPKLVPVYNNYPY